MSTTTRKPGDFTATLFGAPITDREQFEKLAKARRGPSGRALVGAEVVLTIDGKKVRGQVWDQAPRRGWLWVALDNGTFQQMKARDI